MGISITAGKSNTLFRKTNEVNMYEIQPLTPQANAKTSGALHSGKKINRVLNRRTKRIDSTAQNVSKSTETIGINFSNFPFLNGIGNEELQDINSRVVNQKYQKKEFIYLPYDRSEKVYFIIHGNVEIGYLDESGRELSLDILGAGEVFGYFMGESFSFRNESRVGGSMIGEFARSLDNSVLAIINKNDFEMFVEKYHRFSFKMLKMMGQRINTLETKLQNLVFSDVKTRICKLLFSLYQKAGDKRSGQIKIPLTHQDIANLVASSRETASLHLSDLKKSGTISYERKRIRITSLTELQRCSECCS
jgi:CRP-like cAMP-binding protein